MEGSIEYKTIANSKHNEQEMSDEDVDDTGDNNDDIGYESWTEGNWCWLLPNTATSALATRTTKNNKTTHTIRVRCRKGKSKATSRKGTYTQGQNERWNKKFGQLVAYKENYQNTDVPYGHTEDPHLGEWVKNQRCLYRNKTISKDRIDLLNSIGFVWDNIYHSQWMKMYQRLVAYKKQHKSTSVPKCYKEDQKLAKWISYQRRYHKKKKKKLSMNRYIIWNP